MSVFTGEGLDAHGNIQCCRFLSWKNKQEELTSLSGLAAYDQEQLNEHYTFVASLLSCFT